MTQRPPDSAMSPSASSAPPHAAGGVAPALHDVGATPPVEVPGSVPVPRPWPISVYQSVAFALSALLSPYLVIPFGTVGVVSSLRLDSRGLVKWTVLSVLFSTAIPALFVVIQILRGRITDVHVMEREQRSGPFLVAVVSCGIGAVVLWKLHAPSEVWMLTVVMAVNGLILHAITSFWKISMHVAVLSSTVLAAALIIPEIGATRIACMAWMVPALIWARVTRQRHSLLQGVAACLIAGAVTGTVVLGIRHLTSAG